jgi:hypothetical protein
MKSKLLTLFTITAIFLTAVASATVYETNYFYDGIIENGELVQGTTPLTAVNVIGFVCADENCETTSTRLWAGTINSGGDNEIILQYPEYLLSEHGYIVYFFKPGYIPSSIQADWFGNGNTESYDNYLYKLDEEYAGIQNFEISDDDADEGDEITITADILSPMIYSNNLFVPEELIEEYYSSTVDVTLEITNDKGELVYAKTKNLNIEFSSEQEVEFTWTTPDIENDAEFEISLTTEVTDEKILETTNQIKSAKIEVNADDEPDEPSEPEDKKSSSHKQAKTINLDDTTEDEQYENQFKSATPTDEEEPEPITISKKLSWWNKFINWLKSLF